MMKASLPLSMGLIEEAKYLTDYNGPYEYI